MSGLEGDDELHEGHLLGAHQIHGGQVVEELHFSLPLRRTEAAVLASAQGVANVARPATGVGAPAGFRSDRTEPSSSSRQEEERI